MSGHRRAQWQGGMISPPEWDRDRDDLASDIDRVTGLPDYRRSGLELGELQNPKDSASPGEW